MWSSMVYWYNTLLYVLSFTAHNLILLSCYLCVFFCVLLKKLRFNKYIFWADLTQHNILYALLYCRHVQNHFIFCYQKLSSLWESWVGWKELSQLIHLYVLLSWALIYNSHSHWVSFICRWVHHSTTIGNIYLCFVWFSGNIFIVWSNVKQGVDLRPLVFFS